MKKTYVCLDCQTEFKPAVSVVGIICIALGVLVIVIGVPGGAGLAAFILGGIFMAVGAFAASGKRCTACGSKRAVPSDTPAGQKILKAAKP